MQKLLLRQWNDIKGNFKYDVMKALTMAAGSWLLTKFELLKHLPGWAVPLFIFVCSLAVLLWMHRKQDSRQISAGMTPEEWTAAGRKLVQIINRKFTHEQVDLDGREFIGCSFFHCNLFYDGTAPMSFQNCDFDPDTSSHFHSHNPAMAQWIEILRNLNGLKPGLQFAITPPERRI